MSTTLLYDDRMLGHDAGPGHPERPARLRAIVQALDGLPADVVHWREPNAAPAEALCLAHDSAHVQALLGLRGTQTVLDHDTATSPGSVDAALLAAGAAIGAVDSVLSEPCSNAFALVRPPGHHAERSRAMGFCLFNNIAVAATHGITAHGLERAMIIDWDVHHGNGTQDIFYDRNDVLYVSAHQWPWYPGTGALDEVGSGDGEGFTVNAPLPAHVDNAAMLALFARVVAPIARQYEPQLILVSAGFDAHTHDPLGQLDLTDDGFAALTRWAMELAGALDAPLVYVLEGGYDTAALGRSVRACVEQLAGLAEPQAIDDECDAVFENIIDQIALHHRRYWTSLE